MRKVGIIALALLLAAASGVQARGARFKGSGGSHGSSHSTPHAESSDGGVHLPSVRPRSQDSSDGESRRVEVRIISMVEVALTISDLHPVWGGPRMGASL